MPFLLWIFGLLFIFLEFFLPGAIMGVIGSLMLIASIYTFVSDGYSVEWIVLFVLAILISLIALCRYALWRIPRLQGGLNIYSADDQEGFRASEYDATLIGEKGAVLSDLKPGGYILLKGKQYQAISQSGYIAKGSEVVVIGGEGESLLVMQKLPK